MPLVPDKGGPAPEQAPREPHLGVLTQEYGSPTVMPISKGAIMVIIEDPRDVRRGMFPIAVVKVTHKRLEFQCPCGASNCTRRVVFNATWTGKHPHGTPEFSIKK